MNKPEWTSRTPSRVPSIDRLWSAAAMLMSALFLYHACRVYLSALRFAPLNPDAGYFLPVARRIARGEMPFRDFALAYPPLALWLFAALSRVKAAGFSDALRIVFCAHALTGGLVFAVARRISSRSGLPLLAGSFAFAIAVLYEGTAVTLEPVVNVPATLAILLFFWSRAGVRMELAGACVGAAVLAKQYALFEFAALAAALFFHADGRRVERLLRLLGGFLAPLVGFAVYATAHSVSLSALHTNLFPAWYAAEGFSLAPFVSFVLCICPPLVSVPFLALHDSPTRRPMLVALGLLFTLSCAPLFVRSYLHYYLLLIPAAALLTAYAVDLLASKSIVAGTIALATLCLPLYAVASVDSFDAHSGRAEQLQLALDASTVLPERSRVLLLANPFLFFTNEYLPIDDFAPGYSFLLNFDAHRLQELLERASHVLVDLHDRDYFVEIRRRIEADGADYTVALREAGLVPGRRAGSLQVWERPS